MTPELTPERRAKLRRVIDSCTEPTELEYNTAEIAALLDAADERDQLRAENADADLLLGNGWQESLKAVNGDPQQAVHHQLAKVVGDNAILEADHDRLAAENERLRGLLAGYKSRLYQGNAPGYAEEEQELVKQIDAALAPAPTTQGAPQTAGELRTAIERAKPIPEHILKAMQRACEAYEEGDQTPQGPTEEKEMK